MGASKRTSMTPSQRAGARIGAILFVANACGAALAYFYLAILSDASDDFDNEDVLSFVVFVAYMVLSVPVGFWRGRRAFRPVADWLDAGRPPTPEEQLDTLAQPLRQATQSFVAWAAAAFVFGGLNLLFESGRTLQIMVGILLGGITTAAICHLLIERSLRPVFALALVHGAPRVSARSGIRPRLVLSWALGSAVPVAGIIRMLSLDEPTRNVRGALLFLALQALVVGGLFVVIAAKSVADPLTSVRAGLDRVQQGDLDVTLPVDDGGEVGLLQSGFNSMVSGLRERRRIQDLFGRHVGAEVARRALDESAGLQARRRQASVLFVDLVGSTAMAHERDPEDVVAMLNDFFGAVVRAIDHEGGWVNKFEGDGAMCVFGAPGDQPDHATRALRAARRLTGDLRRLASVHPALDAGIGVSSGAVVAGNVGAAERYEYTVIGDPVNEAARLTEAAKTRPLRVLVAAAAVDGSDDQERERWQPAGEVSLRGRSTPTAVYEPVANLPDESAFDTVATTPHR